MTLREHHETARAGVKWSDDEDTDLMKRVSGHMDLEDIAKEHQRTISGVKSRIMTIALNIMKDQELSLGDVANMVHLSVKDLENYKRSQEQKTTKPSKPQRKATITPVMESKNNNLSAEQFMNILTEIRDYLKIIAEK